MYSFHVTVQMRPYSVEQAVSVNLNGEAYTPLSSRELLRPVAMQVSFEQAAERLQQLPRLFFEPDGSFVWVGQDGDRRWQVDGQLTDRDGCLLYVELRGSCPAQAFDRLLAALGWPATPMVFQLTRDALFLDEGEFRRFAERSGQAKYRPKKT
jgi:hypothetical protein